MPTKRESDSTGHSRQSGKAVRPERPDSPISRQDIVDLFDYLEDALYGRDCDHSFHLTEAYLASRGLNLMAALQWLRGYGAACDCAILEEVEHRWRDHA